MRQALGVVKANPYILNNRSFNKMKGDFESLFRLFLNLG